MTRGAVLVRSADRDLQLQALRTALSLSLGDRPADLLIAPAGLSVLSPEPQSEAAHCLEVLRQVGLGIELDSASVPSLVHHDAEVLPHEEFVDRLATAPFLQVF